MKLTQNIKYITKSSLVLLLASSIIYAAGTLTSLESGNVITADNWNAMVQEITDLKTANIDLQSQIGTLGASSGSTPSGAVMSFDLESCPTGWTEYTPAYGRFIRGIDKSGENIDVDGERVLGNIQEDDAKIKAGAFGVHFPFASGTRAMNVFGPRSGDPDYRTSTDAGNTYYRGVTKASYGGDETRPKNVALLYCKKN